CISLLCGAFGPPSAFACDETALERIAEVMLDGCMPEAAGSLLKRWGLTASLAVKAISFAVTAGLRSSIGGCNPFAWAVVAAGLFKREPSTSANVLLLRVRGACGGGISLLASFSIVCRGFTDSSRTFLSST